MGHLARVLGFGGFIAVLALCGSTDALAQKKKKDGKDYPRATDDDYKAIQKQKELSGTLVAVDTGVLTVRVEFSQYVSNPKYKPPKTPNTNGNSVSAQLNRMMRDYNDLQVQMQRAATAKTPQQALQAQQRINRDLVKWQQDYANFVAKNNQALVQLSKTDPNNMPFITVSNTKDYDLEIQEKVVCRKLNLPLEYDDTGNIKTYSEKEKADLRGDDKSKPGYMAKFEEVRSGQEVKLSLTPPKKQEKPKDAPKEKDADAPKDKDAPKEPVEVLRPTINMIVITKDNMTASIQPDDNKKKKKN